MTHTGCLAITAASWLLIFNSTARSDEFVRAIPADGTWAKFHWSEHWNNGEEEILHFTFKSVGTKTVDDRRCRWIEVRMQSEQVVHRDAGDVIKLLVREQEFQAGGDAIKTALEVWYQSSGTDAVKIEGIVDNPRLYLLLFPLLQGRVREQQLLKDRETIAWQRGTINCSVVEGKVSEQFTSDHAKGHCRFAVQETMPFGFALARLEIDNRYGKHGVISLSLIDHGTAAASDLPGVN